MRNPKVIMVVFIHVILAVLLPGSAFEFNLTTQKAGGVDKLTFKIGRIPEIGLYYAAMHLGQTQYHLNLDTGSSYTWVQCAGEHAKQAPNPPYQPLNNPVLKNDPNCPSSSVNNGGYPYCDFYNLYLDGASVSGLMYKDFFHFRDMETSITRRAPLVFGCGQYINPNWGEHIYYDGILGLGKIRSSFPSQLNALHLTTKFFAHCFKRRIRVTTSAGYGFFGQGGASQTYNDVVWLPMQNSRSSYVVGPARLSFDGISHHLDVAAIVVDTGSTYTVFAPPIYRFIEHVVKLGVHQAPLQLIEGGHPFLPVCWKHHRLVPNINEVKPYFMPIKLEFTENGIIELKPEDYLTITESGNICLGIVNSRALGNRAINLLGANAMLDKLVIYDNERSRIGWGPSSSRSCTSTTSSGIELQTELLDYVSTNANSSIPMPH